MNFLRVARRSLGGLFPRRFISNAAWRSFFAQLQPVFCGWELLRIGSNGDGGYLVPKDFLAIEGCISPGVSDKVTFESELSKLFRIPTLALDGSVDSLPFEIPLVEFRKVFVGSRLRPGYLSLSAAMAHFERAKDDTLILQMDIEGDELVSLQDLDLDLLRKFRIILIEFHNLEDWVNKTVFTKLVEPNFNALLNNFDVVHVHPNNCDGVFRFAGREYPRAIEVTFHAKNRRLSSPVPVLLPHKLDVSNSDKFPEIKLKF